jgi:lipopolysaccharide transport system permease protein
VLPLSRTLSALATQAFGLVIFLALLAITRGAIPPTVALLPLVLVPQVAMTLGLSYLLSATGTFLKDLAQIIGFLLTLWFFLTPICYPDTSLPAAVAPLLGKNPLYVLVRAYRAILVEGRLPEWIPLVKLYLISGVILVLGWAWFGRLRSSFADVL